MIDSRVQPLQVAVGITSDSGLFLKKNCEFCSARLGDLVTPVNGYPSRDTKVATTFYNLLQLGIVMLGIVELKDHGATRS